MLGKNLEDPSGFGTQRSVVMMQQVMAEDAVQHEAKGQEERHQGTTVPNGKTKPEGFGNFHQGRSRRA
jgi:hypothetical protein